MTRYDLAYLAATPLLAPALLWKAWKKGKYRESAPAMLGRQLAKEPGEQWRDGCIWVHAVSVGETVAARAMLPLLREAVPGLPLLLTTMTETGQARARDVEGTLAEGVRYFPADFSWIVRRFLRTYRPRVLVLMETELWPNVLNIVAEAGIPIIVMNGKISPRAYRGYSRARVLLRRPLSRVSAYCMQSEGDAWRIGQLIEDPARVHVTGNCKFDVPMEALSSARREELRARLGLSGRETVIVAGSTHPGEEEIVVEAFRQIRSVHPEALLLLVPRHPERFGAVWQMLLESGLPVRRSSTPDGGAASPAILLVDEMGLLSQLYGLGEIAVVAGSFVPGIGGHNLLEAAIHQIPVVYGPYMHGQPDMVRILNERNGGIVAPAEELGGKLVALLDNPQERARQGALAREAVLRNRGAAGRNAEIFRRVYHEQV